VSEDVDNFEGKWKMEEGRLGRGEQEGRMAIYQVGNMCESGMERNDKRGLAKAVEETNGK
jgi:hypothetical protein